MAKQHFYSCVPAKMSLFNKMDGYDTFAHSEGVTREQIERLSLVYDNKPTKEDAVLIREGALPTVYCRFTDEDGTAVQSAVSYIKSDYTGERSSYMVHSLLLSDGEKKASLETADAAALNPDMFKKDLSDFDLTSPSSKPITDYAELKVKAAKPVSTESIAEKYDTGILKRIIFSLISIVCGKTKAFYLSLPSPIESFSEDCLNFLNGILQIFPYYMRRQMSFVTYAGDTSKFAGFKIKCVREEVPAVPTSKGITIKTGIKEFTGVSDEVIAANATVVDFFYGLLTKDEQRKAFIEFCRYAAEKNPALEKANFKTLSDLIFLFRYLSGFYDESTVIPDDTAVYNFVAVYDKNREALTEEYRSRAMKCLHRYPNTHTVIPKNVFSKVTSMYPTETEESRSTVMAVVLELIHTDVMRDKLFSFIKQYYAGESAEIKKTITENLCRVYYGGFLQEQLLDFFKANFENEPTEVRSLILEKLFLTVRTPKVQNMVLGFIDEFYDLLSEGEKAKFYEIVYEMLPEGDKLSRALADVIDLHIEEERREELQNHIISAVEADEKRAEPKLCRALCTKCGFTEKTLAQKIFTDWKKRKTVDTFIECMCEKNISEALKTVKEVWNAAGEIPADIAEKMLEALKTAFSGKAKTDLFGLIAAAEDIDTLKGEVPAAAEFTERLKAELLLPQIAANIHIAFDFKHYPEGVENVVEAAQNNAFLKDMPEYKSIEEYIAAVDCLKSGKATEMFVHSDKISGNLIRQGAAFRFKKEVKATDKGSVTDETLMMSHIVEDFLATDEIKIINPANSLRERIMMQMREQNSKAKPEQLAAMADEKAVLCLLTVLSEVLNSDISEDTRAKITAENGELQNYLALHFGKYGKKAKKAISAAGGSIHPACLEAVERAGNVKPQSTGFFGKLFKK